jgi:predicted nucleotidyltransferase
MPVQAQADKLLDRLTSDLVRVLGSNLRSVIVHGSYVAGGFEPDRSDLDLLAVVAAPVTTALVSPLADLHDAVVAEYPAWTDRLELEVLDGPAIERCHDRPHDMIRLSPDEPLHLIVADCHHLAGWYAARTYGKSLYGSAPTEVIPLITKAQFLDVVRDHASQWPTWAAEADTPRSQAYAVLTICRAVCTLTDGRQVSKREAARWASQRYPAHAALIGWAEGWWYHHGSDREPRRDAEVADLVADLSLRAARTPPPEDGR